MRSPDAARTKRNGSRSHGLNLRLRGSINSTRNFAAAARKSAPAASDVVPWSVMASNFRLGPRFRHARSNARPSAAPKNRDGSENQISWIGEVPSSITRQAAGLSFDEVNSAPRIAP